MKKQPPKPKKQMFEPQKGKLLILRKEEEKVSEGGIFILDNAKEKPQQGDVLATHPENQYKKGDVLLFPKYAGTDVKLNGAMFLILPEEEVLGRIVEE